MRAWGRLRCGMIANRRGPSLFVFRATPMPKVHSHYENLKVARDASIDDIRGAYRALTRRHHPDRNPHNADPSGSWL